MSQERTEAIVLRGVDWSETSRIVTFLTPERGKLACLAAGARRPKSGVGALLDTFNRLELVYYWKSGRSVQKLGEVALLDGFGDIKSSLEKAVYAAFTLEFAYKVAQENEPSYEIYATLAHGLEQLAAWTGDVRTHVAWQTVHLLAAAGFGLDLAKPRSRSVEGLLTPNGRALSADALDILERLVGTWDQCPVSEETGEVFHALGRYTATHLEIDFRSLRVIREMFG